MKITYCDKCGERLNTYRFHVTYSGNNTVEFCEKCANEFKEWLNGNALEDKVAYLAESRDWWREQCKEFYEDYKVVTQKLSKTCNDLVDLIAKTKEYDAE